MKNEIKSAKRTPTTLCIWTRETKKFQNEDFEIIGYKAKISSNQSTCSRWESIFQIVKLKFWIATLQKGT